MDARSDRRILGIDLGGTSTKLIALDSSGAVVAEASFPTHPERGPEAVLREALRVFQDAAVQAGFDSSAVGAVGLGSPGPLDLKSGRIVTTPNLRWADVPLRDLCRDVFGCPVHFENDAVAATYGEWRAGCAQGRRNVVGLTLGTGLGGGLILNGSIFRGAVGHAGHIGHMIVHPQGRLCGCGNRGCLEAQASGTAIAAAARDLLTQGQTSGLREPITALSVVQHARAGDGVAKEALADCARWVAVGINNLINLINPEIVVLMGQVANAWDLLEAPLRERLSQLAFPGMAESLEIRPGALKGRSGALGAAWIALEGASA